MFDEELRKEIYQNTDVFLMCFSIDNQDSLENIERKWWPEVHQVYPNGTAFSRLLLISYYLCKKMFCCLFFFAL